MNFLINILNMNNVIILHHHEITLKKKNRNFFEKQLHNNLKIVLPKNVEIVPQFGRTLVKFSELDNNNLIIDSLKKVFGIANICVGYEVESNIEKFCEMSFEMLKEKNVLTFKIDTNRVDKSFPIKSMDVNKIVGEFVCRNFSLKAKMQNPDVAIYIEIIDENSYIYSQKIYGANGLPVGVSGKTISLISAGFDSPIASYKIIKRGAKCIFVHFHSRPYTSENSILQVESLIKNLTQYQFESKLYLVPFANLQQNIVSNTNQKLRIILYRRFMVRIAEIIAQKESALALVTGDSLGQVASQTLKNIFVINEVANLPILRPLIGFDKEEIMKIAIEINTYNISKEPFDDCCSYLSPRTPETWANLNEVIEEEKKLDSKNLIDECLKEIKVKTFSYQFFFE